MKIGAFWVVHLWIISVRMIFGYARKLIRKFGDMNKRICNIRNRWLGVVLSLVLCLALVFSLVPPMANGSASADEEGRDYPVMRPDRETLEEWIEAYNNAPRAYIEPEGFEAAAFGGSKDLLSYLEYIPDDRD